MVAVQKNILLLSSVVITKDENASKDNKLVNKHEWPLSDARHCLCLDVCLLRQAGKTSDDELHW